MTTPSNSTPEKPTLPVEARWDELSATLVASERALEFDGWLEGQLQRLESQHEGFVTPNSLNKFLCGGRK